MNIHKHMTILTNTSIGKKASAIGIKSIKVTLIIISQISLSVFDKYGLICY